ncbi:MAG: hypothetical protein OXB92_10105 [Acidimicrobiaceae bacterium]|nr:hypothetical protein [Acidimicrobiia bacterium]MCY4494196.1 hypothetical protein [Acidimicrobiaceae bacterium]
MTNDSTAPANHKARKLAETTRELPDDKAAEARIAALGMVGEHFPHTELTAG